MKLGFLNGLSTGNLGFSKAVSGGGGGGDGNLPLVDSATLLLDLEADTLSVGNGNPISTWADQSGNGRNFTAAGDARPLQQTDGNGYKYVQADGVDDFMTGPNFADGLSAFALIAVVGFPALVEQSGVIVAKATDVLGSALEPGWYWDGYGTTLNLFGSEWVNYVIGTWAGSAPTEARHVLCGEVLSYSPSDVNIYVDGVDNNLPDSDGEVTDISNDENVLLFTDTNNTLGFSDAHLYALLVYQITNAAGWTTDRAAITAWLANRYGISI